MDKETVDAENDELITPRVNSSFSLDGLPVGGTRTLLSGYYYKGDKIIIKSSTWFPESVFLNFSLSSGMGIVGRSGLVHTFVVSGDGQHSLKVSNASDQNIVNGTVNISY